MKKKTIKLCSFLSAVVLCVAAGLLTPAAAGNAPPDRVLVGGMPFGVKFYTDGVLVVGFCDVDGDRGAVNPARDAGLKVKDIITKINGEAPRSANSLADAVESSDGRPVVLTVRRSVPHSGKDAPAFRELTVMVKPCRSQSENRYKTGVWVRDSGAGIGTVTYIRPDTHEFAGLGHGICDGDTGELIPMQRGQITDVTINGVERGEIGKPGAIKGCFTPGKTGTLTGNTESGVYGLFASLPPSAAAELPVGHPEDITPGDATILCTLDNGDIGRYTVRITSVDYEAPGSKCFTLTVTDPELLRKTGGIVQGMSGSPVIQNGKLVGAVTHVLINDPTSGYGIFIDHMRAHMPSPLS